MERNVKSNHYNNQPQRFGIFAVKFAKSSIAAVFLIGTATTSVKDFETLSTYVNAFSN